MSPDRIEGTNRVVISSVTQGDVIPGKRDEMRRDVIMLPGGHVRGGGVFGEQLLIEGPNVRIDRAVYAQERINIAPRDPNEANGTVTFGSVVATRGSIQVGDSVRFRVRFQADVYAKSVHLNNAIVFGHVFADNAVVTNSVILGSLYCEKLAQLSDCMLGTFDVGSVKLGDNVSLFLPAAFARKPIEVPGSVRILSFYRLGLREEENVLDAMGGAIHLSQRDVYREELVRDGVSEERFALSLAPRVLDGDPLLEHLEANRKALSLVAATDHMRREDRARYRGDDAFWIEDRLLGLVERRDLPEAGGYSPFTELLDRPYISAALRAHGVANPEELLHSLRAPIEPE